MFGTMQRNEVKTSHLTVCCPSNIEEVHCPISMILSPDSYSLTLLTLSDNTFSPLSMARLTSFKKTTRVIVLGIRWKIFCNQKYKKIRFNIA